MELNERLKAIRKKSKKTQKEFADIIGIGLRTLKSYENGNTIPSYDTLKKYHNICKYSYDYIFGESEEDMVNRQILDELKTFYGKLCKLIQIYEKK